jgi:Glycosyl transferase family 2
MPKISIIIPTHSRPHLLLRAVESVRNAGTDLEIIVVDDASTDATAEVCKSLADIKYIRLDRNQGVAGARNIGIVASTADYIAFHDDDDARLPGTLDQQLEVLKADPNAGLVYSPVKLVAHDGQIISESSPPDCPEGDIFWEVMKRNFIYPQAAIIRKACFYKVGLLNSGIPGFDEWDLWVRIAELYKVVVVGTPVTHYTIPTPKSGQLTTSMSHRLCTDSVRHQLKLLQLPRAIASSREKRMEARSYLLNLASDKLVWDASNALVAGTKNVAREMLFAAIKLHPARAFRPWTIKMLLLSYF